MLKILADTAADLSPASAEHYGITLVPSYIRFGAEQIKDSEITPPEILARAQHERRPPVTSEPTRQDWTAAFEEALQSADEVLSLHTSSRLSRSYETATQAARLFGGRVHTLDSGTSAYALGWQALRAAEMVDHGVATAELIDDLRDTGKRQFGLFMADTLDYLRMSGRVGGLSAFWGGLLGVKPLLGLQGGTLVPAGQPRGLNAALEEIGRALTDFAGQGTQGLRVAYLYSPGGEAAAEQLRQQLTSWGHQDGGTHPAGPILTGFAGPGMVGLVAEPIRPLPKGRTPGHSNSRYAV